MTESAASEEAVATGSVRPAAPAQRRLMSHERLNCVCARWYNTDMGPIPSEGGARSAWRAGLSVALCLSILGMADAASGQSLRNGFYTGLEMGRANAVLVQRQRFGGVRLGGRQECRELDPIDTELAVVVVGIAAAPARAAVAGAGLRCPALLRWIAGMAGQRRADQAFEAAFGGVGRRHGPGPSNLDFDVFPRRDAVDNCQDVVNAPLDARP